MTPKVVMRRPGSRDIGGVLPGLVYLLYFKYSCSWVSMINLLRKYYLGGVMQILISMNFVLLLQQLGFDVRIK